MQLRTIEGIPEETSGIAFETSRTDELSFQRIESDDYRIGSGNVVTFRRPCWL